MSFSKYALDRYRGGESNFKDCAACGLPVSKKRKTDYCMSCRGMKQMVSTERRTWQEREEEIKLVENHHKQEK